MDNHYLDQLNKHQSEAVMYCDGPQLVIAGAGSGKTRVLTYKIVHLLQQGMQPYHIVALTFTNKAAREMRDRIEQLVGADSARRLWMGTFHSIFARLLRVNAERLGFHNNYTIYDTNDSVSLIKMLIRDHSLDDKVYKPSTLLNIFSRMKNSLISPDDYLGDRHQMNSDEHAGRPLTAMLYREYCSRCRQANAMDFDDLLYYTNVMLRDCPDLLAKYQQLFQYILIDEYQDVNFAQHAVVRQLSEPDHKLCAVGDDAQSIYSFRGANINHILTLDRNYPDLRTFKLERNYRSTQAITNAANSLIAKNHDQIVKHLFSENAVGERLNIIQCYTNYEEAYIVANQIAAIKARHGDCYNDFAVLYRTNAQSRVLEEALSNGGRRDKHGNVRHAIPYRIYGGLAFYERKEIKDVVGYLRLTINPNDDEALRRVINTPARGIGTTTMTKLQHCAIENGVSIWHVITNLGEYDTGVNSGTAKRIAQFVQLIGNFMAANNNDANAYTIARTVVERTHILDQYAHDATPENISRQENIKELLSAARIFVDQKLEQGLTDTTLADFLAEVSLTTDQDSDDGGDDRVTLMTMHAAKGLEFKNVIIVGLEEGLIPMTKSNTRQELEEERRLLYVAITRAERTCVLTHAMTRNLNGSTSECTESRFLGEIDPQYLSSATTSNADNSTTRRASRVDVDTLRRQWRSLDTAPCKSSDNSGARNATAIPSRPSPQRSNINTQQSRGNALLQKIGSGSFTTHNISEMKPGMAIMHSHFGDGVVEEVVPEDGKIIVTFADGHHTLLLKYAKFFIVDNA